jgi:hypothetical protein
MLGMSSVLTQTVRVCFLGKPLWRRFLSAVCSRALALECEGGQPQQQRVIDDAVLRQKGGVAHQPGMQLVAARLVQTQLSSPKRHVHVLQTR